MGNAKTGLVAENRGKIMDLNNLTIFNMINKERSYLTERQKVLATNIANANTPGYLPKDVEKPDFAAELKSSTLALRVTNPKHMQGLPSQGFSNRVYTPKLSDPLSIDGNGVILEDQLNEVSKVKGDYNRMLSIYTSYKNMLKTANTKINA